jgi:amidophosphoribosyltransferase
MSFEVGVFCGRYQTEVPDGYFDHLNELRGRNRKVDNVIVEELRVPLASGDGGPVGGPERNSGHPAKVVVQGHSSSNGVARESAASSSMPRNRDDIRLVASQLLGLRVGNINTPASLHNYAEPQGR